MQLLRSGSTRARRKKKKKTIIITRRARGRRETNHFLELYFRLK